MPPGTDAWIGRPPITIIYQHQPAQPDPRGLRRLLPDRRDLRPLVASSLAAGWTAEAVHMAAQASFFRSSPLGASHRRPAPRCRRASLRLSSSCSVDVSINTCPARPVPSSVSGERTSCSACLGTAVGLRPKSESRTQGHRTPCAMSLDGFSSPGRTRAREEPSQRRRRGPAPLAPRPKPTTRWSHAMTARILAPRRAPT